MTKAAERLVNALDYLAGHRRMMLRAAPDGKEDEYASAYWYPREPMYSWSTAYGDFSPQTLMAGVARGLVDRKGRSHAYRITDAGLALLKAEGQTP